MSPVFCRPLGFTAWSSTRRSLRFGVWCSLRFRVKKHSLESLLFSVVYGVEFSKKVFTV